MKNLFRLLMAALVICATSCTKEDVSSTVVGEGEVIEVTFTAGLADLGTRATTGTGAKVNKLYCKVFDNENDNELTELNTDATRGTDGKFTFRVVMVKGMTYDLVLWAECEANGFDAYQINGKEVTVTYNNGVANDERYDAFCKFVEDFDPVTDNPAFTLTRPLAQLNAATNDYDAVKKSGITLSTSEVTISAFHSFNIATGTASDKSDATFAAAAIPGGDLNTNTGYEYLAVNYLFVSGDSSLVDAKYTFKGTKADTSVVTFTGTDYSAIPLKPNHRTNILGALLTKPADFVVDINADFNPNDEVVNVVTVANAGELQNAINNAPAGENTEIILDGDINLDDLLAGLLSTRAGEPQSLVIPAGKVITLNLGGNTLSHEEEQTAAYGMIVNNGDLTITNGTVIYKDTATYTQDPGWASNTVWNNGILTIEEGTTLINDSSASAAEYGYPHVIDNYAKLTINGGTLTNNTDYSSIRIWCTTDDNTEVVINGGTFNGSIDFQTPNASANKGTLTINGGTFNGDNYTKCATRLLGFGADVDEMVATINGGTFNMGISLRNWSGGELNSNVYTIYGGKFVNLANAVQYLAEGAVISPAADLEVSETITIPAGKNFTLDLAGKTVASESSETGKNFNMFDVRGTMTVKSGTLTTKHVGTNMGWNNSTNVFNITAGGILNLVDVTAKNLGGSDMAFVAHLNNWGECTLNVDNSTLESPYIAVRVFNSGYDMNNVTISNTTLGGKYCLWVHNYIDAGDSVGTDETLNFNIYNPAQNNIFNNTGKAPILYGFDTPICFDAQGNVLNFVENLEELQAALEKEGNIVITKVISPQNVEFEIDGKGKTIYQDCENVYALFDITGGKATFKNVIFDGIKGGAVIRTADAELIADNVTAQNGVHTQQQGLFRLLGKSTITNCTFKNNNCNMVVTFNYDAEDTTFAEVVENCVFENNVCNGTAALYYVNGSNCTINNNQFVGNIVNCSTNSATVYMGFTENNVITNNLFENNTVISTGSSKRVAGGLMIGYEATITGNAFIGNKIEGTNPNAKGNDVCASVYYTDINLSGNYWGGGAPVENDDYFIEYPDNNNVIINDYLTEWNK